MARQKPSVIMPEKGKGGLESSLPVIGGLISTYFGGGYGAGSAAGSGLTSMFKGGSAQGTGTLSRGDVASGQGSSVTGGVQAGGMQATQGMMSMGGSSGATAPATEANMQSNLGSMPNDLRQPEGPSMAGAMDRRYESYSQDPQGDIEKGRTALDSDTSLPPEEKKKLKDVLDKAAYQSQRPPGSTAPLTPYIQNRRY